MRCELKEDAPRPSVMQVQKAGKELQLEISLAQDSKLDLIRHDSSLVPRDLATVNAD